MLNVNYLYIIFYELLEDEVKGRRCKLKFFGEKTEKREEIKNNGNFVCIFNNFRLR